jgi:hypothetical protein
MHERDPLLFDENLIGKGFDAKLSIVSSSKATQNLRLGVITIMRQYRGAILLSTRKGG